MTLGFCVHPTSRYYKIKQKPYERTFLSLSVSFDVWAGDRFLGEFWQSHPLVRLVWDDIVFYDHEGRFVGQLYFSVWRWLFGVVPNLLLGPRTGYIVDAAGSTVVEGSKESLLKTLFSADRRAFDFRCLKVSERGMPSACRCALQGGTRTQRNGFPHPGRTVAREAVFLLNLPCSDSQRVASRPTRSRQGVCACFVAVLTCFFAGGWGGGRRPGRV